MKNTLFNMLRPSFSEQDTDKKEEMTQETVKRGNLSINEDYATSSFLNSDVFVDEGLNILIATPRDMEDAEVIAEAIFANKGVIILLDELKDGMDQRILDFINGVCYTYQIVPRRIKDEKKFVIDPMHKRTTRTYR